MGRPQNHPLIRNTAPGQNGSLTFSKRNQPGPEHPLGILMTLAAKGKWRNPPLSSPDYERVSKAFQRLQTLLRALVPLPAKPFQKSSGAFVPIFNTWFQLPCSKALGMARIVNEEDGRSPEHRTPNIRRRLSAMPGRVERQSEENSERLVIGL
jgi:hypothetical protein